MTGAPVLPDTSFNMRGDPIVNTLDRTIARFLGTEMDGLAEKPALPTPHVSAPQPSP